MPAQHERVDVRADSVDVVHHQVLQLRALAQQLGENTILEHVRDLEPVPDRVQALHRHVIGIVAPFAHTHRPADQRRMQAL
jgi:hypothetical protein